MAKKEKKAAAKKTAATKPRKPAAGKPAGKTASDLKKKLDELASKGIHFNPEHSDLEHLHLETVSEGVTRNS